MAKRVPGSMRTRKSLSELIEGRLACVDGSGVLVKLATRLILTFRPGSRTLALTPRPKTISRRWPTPSWLCCPGEKPTEIAKDPAKVRELEQDFNSPDLRRYKEQPLIGDTRNDENAIVSQLLLALPLAHNKLVDPVRGGRGHR